MALNSRANVVASGVFFDRISPNDTIHNVRLGDNYIRVSIADVHSPEAYLPVPVPNADMYVVKDAHNSHVAWPKEFVLPCVEVTSFFFTFHATF